MEKTTDVGKFVSENRDLINKLNEDFMKSFFSPVSEMYFDLPVLKDTRLGLMISVADETNMKLIRDNIGKYNLRPNRSFTYAFEGFKYSEDELTKMYYNSDYHTRMFNFAVDTDLSILLKKMFDIARDQNIRAEYRDSIRVNINTYPIDSDNQLVCEYTKIMSDYFKDIVFNVICVDPKKLNDKFWLKQNVIVIDDLIKMTSEDCGLFKPWLEDQVMSSVKIFSPYQVLDEVLDSWKKDGRNLLDRDTITKLFQPTELTLQLISNFKFIPNQIPVR